MLLKRMEECVDGEYQDFKSKNGAYVREHFFGKYPETARAGRRHVATMRSGRSPAAAMTRTRSTRPTRRPSKHKGQPTVILAKTVKGYGMGEAGEGQNITHQQKKMGEAHLREFRDRFGLPIIGRAAEGSAVPALPRGQRGSALSARAARGARRPLAGAAGASRSRWQIPPLSAFDAQLKSTGGPHDLDHDGVRAHHEHADARQADRQARRADRARREPHLRHGGHVPPVRHLQPGRPALSAGRRQPADVLQGGPEGADPAGGPERARRDGFLDRGGDLVQQQQRADDPVLHLLLDVRVPANRRLRIGRRATCARAVS